MIEPSAEQRGARGRKATIIFADVPVAESDEDKPGVVLDYNASGNLVAVEIFDVSRRIGLPTRNLSP